jgi:APA family basic amino acid/polyamine antiporter
MAAPGVFTRMATGLVREMSVFDAFLMNVGTMNLVWIATSYFWAVQLFPGADFTFALFIVTVLTLIQATLFTLFTAAMPRSGGEYVFNTRAISPLIGYVVNFSMVVWNIFWIAYTSWFLSAFAASPAFAIVGQATGIQLFKDLGEAAAKPEASFVIGVVNILIVALLSYLGTRAFFRAMRAAFIVGMVGVFALIGTMLLSSHEGFVAGFDAFAGPGAYERTLSMARELGLQASAPSAFSAATFFALAVAFQPLGFAVWSSYAAGEIRNALSPRVHFLSMAGSILFIAAFLALVGELSFRLFGYDFITAVGWIFYNHPDSSPLAIPPSTQLFASLLTSNFAVNLLMAIGFIAWAFLYAPQSMLMVTRCMLAWSLDRLAPERLSRVGGRRSTPYIAITLTAILAIALLWVFIFAPFNIFSIYGFNAFIGGGTITWLAVGLAGILYPYRARLRPHYEASPASKYRLGHIPLIAITGAITVAFMALITYLYLARPEFGVLSMPSMAFLVGIYIVGAAIYYLQRLYYSRRGIRIELAFKEIPPE